MAKQKLGQESKINQNDKIQLSEELNSLLRAVVDYKIIFDGRASSKIPIAVSPIITIKLNAAKTLLCLEHNNNKSEIENDNKIIEEKVYNTVRTTLQDKRTVIPENKWDESFKLAKQQILSYLIKENKLNDRESFLNEFQQFMNELPEVPHKFIDCTRKLKEINFDDWDIEESETNDPRLKALEEIHKTMLDSFDLYKNMGEHYIQLRNQTIINGNTLEEQMNSDVVPIGMENIDIDMFNVVNIPGDGNCFYSAIADQLRRLDIKIKINEAKNQPEAYYTDQDLRAIAIGYIKKNSEKESCKNLEEKLKGPNKDLLHGDLPSNIHTIDQYIELHSKEETWADFGIIGALAQALDIILRIYHQDGTSETYNAPQDKETIFKKIANLQYTGNHYNSLVARSFFELLPFEKKYPEQSSKMRRIFDILNQYERGEKLDSRIEIITSKLGLPHVSIEKLKGYFNASNINKLQKTINYVESGPWYTDEDMNSYGRVLEKHGVNFDAQFSNMLTEDGIKTLPSIESLKENHPRYISYNIGGRANKDNSGIHWVAIVLVKQGDIVTILYKDSKGDWNNSSETAANLFKEHYKDKVNFFKHSQVEQEDDASCGPMTINNLEIMAIKVKEVNDEGKDGIAELIALFKGESGSIAFTTQDQVQNIRITHSLQNKSYSRANLKQDTNVDDLRTIITKLQFSCNDISMKDGKNFNLVTIKGDGNCFYSAVADQLRRLDIKMENNNTNNQLEAYYTHKNLRELTIDYIRNNRGQESCKDLEEQLKDPNTDLPSNVLTFEQYIDLHSKEEVWADSGMVGALAQALDITLKIYLQDGMPATYNALQDAAPSVKKIINLQYTGNHYNSLVDIEDTISTKKEEIESYIQKVGKYYDQLKNWEKDELRTWSRKHKGQLSKNFSGSIELGDKICEAIAVLDRANELATGGQRLRHNQKAAVLIFMQTNTKGHISQINTGEGKTTIVSVVAALKVMQGYKGHVITSNNVLAADGVKDKKLFYDLLNITIADNNPDDKYTDGPRACYNQDIVYGSITSFQFDWLRDSFQKLKTLGGVDFNNIWVMLDEIDSLLIDQGNNIAKLSGPFPGMESLRYVYINIWVALAKTEEQVTQQILAKLKNKCDEFAKDSKSPDDEKQLKYEEYEDSLRESFLEDIKNQIKIKKNHLINKQILATHLHQYAEDSIERWIERAFTAKYQFHENVEYKLTKDKDGENIITPVDNQNTGVSMKNTIYCNGLHQFLQIKHNLCLTYESLTSCYVSNLDYIKKYGSKLSGVTGTLGSNPEKNLLRSVFNVEFSVIPPYKTKHFIQFPGKVSADDKFVNDIAIASLGELTRTHVEAEYLEGKLPFQRSEIKKPRAVLIVCASILDVEIIAKEIDREAKSAGLAPRILKYRDEIDAHITEKALDVCDIVIATNLAGRGTDFRTSATLESNGGLHVIEAFLPCNKRVQDQGFGRTGRQGNKGTGQIIIKISELEALGIAVNNNDNIDFDKIIKRRDELETMRLNDIIENKITELEFKGQLFNKFSSDYGELKEKNKIGSNVIKWIYVLRDLKEKWAFWLEKQAYTAEKIKQIIAKQQSWFTKKENYCLKAVEQEYNNFFKEAKPIINGTITHNPFYSICLAERYLENSTNKSDREKAKLELAHALNISESSELLYSAYIKLFEIAIEEGGQVLERYKKAVAKIFFFPLESNCPDYKKHAVENLQKAAKALAIEHDYLEKLISGKGISDTHEEKSVLASIIISGEEAGSENSQQNQGIRSNPNLFVKHLQARLVCLGAFKGNIESLLKQINGENELENPRDSIGPNDGVIIDARVPRYLSKLDSQNELKQYITDRSVNELEYVGMSSVYQLRKIHDVHEEVITGAQIQIGGAFVLLASAVAFPVMLPVNGPLAGAMISEGITDIITALIQQGQSAFNSNDYIKGKVISYGISIITMGIGAIMSSTKILRKAVNACRSLATKLRSVKGPFAGICTFLASKLDKLVIYLENIIEKIEVARKMAAEQAKHICQLKDIDQLQKFQQLQKTMKFTDVVITHGQKITQIVTQAVIGAVKGVVISVAIERVVIASLNNLMAGLQPLITEKVHTVVSTKIKYEDEKGTFNNVTDLEINQTIQKLLETSLGEDIKHVSKEIALGILRHSSNWKMQIATLAFESVLSGVDIAICTNKICNKFVEDLKKRSIANTKHCTHTVEVIDRIVTQMSDLISGILYSNIVAITGKVVVTLPKAFYRGYKEHQEQKADEKAIADMRQKLTQIDTADEAAKAGNAKCGHDAVSEILGQDSKQLADATNLVASENGASIDDTRQLFIQNGIEATTCGAEIAQSQFIEQNSDRGVVCLSSAQNPGHIMPVTMESNCLMVTESGQKIPLDQYKQDHGYTNAEFVIPKGVNSSTLEDIQHKCNLNRIVKATHSINYVGQDGEQKFGFKPGTQTKRALQHKQQEIKKRDEEIQKIVEENCEEKPPYSMKGSAVLKASDGVRGDFSKKSPGHATDHLTHKGFSDKESHTVFRHGTKQQEYLADKASQHPEFQAKAKEVQKTRQRVVFDLPIGEILKPDLAPQKRKEYMQATERASGGARNMKYVKFIIDPAAPGSDRPYQMQTMYPVTKENQDQPNIGLKGINLSRSANIGRINSYFGEYTLNAIKDILEVRINNVGLEDVTITRGEVFSRNYNNLQGMIYDITESKSRIILAPLNLYNEHATGIVGFKTQDNELKLYYIDPSNETIPVKLKQIFIDNDLHITQLPAEPQLYTNCGPEVIENFMLYLTGERLSQEDAIVHNSRLIEQELLSAATSEPLPLMKPANKQVIPIEGSIKVNYEIQKSSEQILPKIIIVKELSNLCYDKKSMPTGYVEVKNIHCIQGKYSDFFNKLELYENNHGTEQDHTEIFSENQLFIAFELANAGQDLENYKFQNAAQTYSVFLQISLSLAVAESNYKFEHRDLHWGNVLVFRTDEKQIVFKLNDKDINIETNGVKATITDYTLSRMIFDGDQYEVYRLIKQSVNNDWGRYEPFANVLWLHYIIDKIISGVHCRQSKRKNIVHL